MRFPTLKQLTGLVMIVNTFLPAIVLAVAVWLILDIKREACDSIRRFDRVSREIDLLFDGRFHAIRAGVKKGKIEPQTGIEIDVATLVDRQRKIDGEGECLPFGESRRQIARIVRQSSTQVRKDLEQLGNRITAPARFIRTAVVLKPIPLPRIPLARDVVTAYNDHVRPPMNAVLITIRDSVNNAIFGLLNPETIFVHLEVQKAQYKLAAYARLAGQFTTAATSKLAWFILVLSAWLALSYVLWAYRRLATGWALLRGRNVDRVHGVQV